MLSCQRIRLSERRDLHRPNTTSDGDRRTCSARNNQNKNIQIHKPISAHPKTPLYITTLRLPLNLMPSPKKAPRPARSARYFRRRGGNHGNAVTQLSSGSSFDKTSDLLISGTELPERTKREPKPESEIITARFEPRLACCLRRNNSIPNRAPSKICSRAQRAMSNDRGNLERRCKLSTSGQERVQPGANLQPGLVNVIGTRTASPNTLKVIRVDLINLRPHTTANCCDEDSERYDEYSDYDNAVDDLD